jgi:hypothetical protein
MKIRLLITALVISLSLGPASLLAQQEMPEGHAEHHPESVSSGPAAPNEPSAENTTATEENNNEDSTDSMLTFMQQRMAEMISHWDKMNETEDPAERQQLMLEHRQKMMALNAMMGNMAQQPGMMGPGRGMMGGMMGQGRGMEGGMMGQGRGMMGRNMMGQGRGMGGRMMSQGMMDSGSEAGLQEAFQELEKRVDLLQQMVEYLIDN